MAHLISNSFSSYSLSEEEVTQGTILTLTQQQVIQNRLVIIAEEKLALEYDSTSPSAFMQQEAYKKGQIDILRYMLDDSLALQELQEVQANDY